MFGVIAVTFAAGLGTSLDRVETDLSHAAAQPVQVSLPGPPGRSPVRVSRKARRQRAARPSLAAQEHAVQAELRAQPGTLHYVAEADDEISVLGLADRVSLIAFGGDPSWTGYALVTGHWYTGTGERVQADVNTPFLTATGTAVGDTYTLTSGGQARHGADRRRDLRPGRRAPGDLRRAAHPGGPGSRPGREPVRRGAEAGRQRPGVRERGRPRCSARTTRSTSSPDSNPQFLAILGLVATMTLLLAAVAGLGGLNTVVLQIRERVHDIGVFKAVGMTPRQTMVMVVCSVAGIGLVAGLIAIPAGIVLHHYVLPVMGHAAQTDVPPSVLNVYRPWELVLLALAGLAIAVAGALGPGGLGGPDTHRVRAARRVARRPASGAARPPARRAARPHSRYRSVRPGGRPAGQPPWAAPPARTRRTTRTPAAPARRRTPPPAPAPPRAGRRRAAARTPASRPPGRARRRSRPN